MPTIVHFEILADDVERSKKFYSDLFGWKIEKWSGSDSIGMDYWTINTPAINNYLHIPIRQLTRF